MRFLSLFSGIEAASAAWKPLGWECAAVAEIDPFPCAALAHHYPSVPNLGNVSLITDEQIAALGRIDLVVGGSPCQDLSVAGKRAGLSGARSGLFHEQLRIFHAAKSLCGARFLLWENVPGAFSSNGGRDFALVAGAMAGCSLTCPRDGWGSEGLALGTNGLVEWCVLDAQWFGVAQRRRRVFALLDTGDWRSRAPILLEPESLRGDSPPSREAGERPAPTISARTSGGGGLGTDFDCDGGVIRWPADVATTLDAHYGDKMGLENQHVNGGGLCSSLPDVAMCLNAGAMGRQDAESETLIPTGGCFDVAHSLRGEGFDASEDGTGRGTPLVPVAFSCKDHSADAGEISPTLRSMGHDGSHANGGGQVAIAFAQNPRDEVRLMEVAGALAAEPGAKQQTYAQIGMAVRRLTPRECERLQGFPDDFTAIPWRKKPAADCPDGPRYKALGNSMAVPVMAWIGRQIEQACEAQA